MLKSLVDAKTSTQTSDLSSSNENWSSLLKIKNYYAVSCFICFVFLFTVSVCTVLPPP
jgi:hypothetical protein